MSNNRSFIPYSTSSSPVFYNFTILLSYLSPNIVFVFISPILPLAVSNTLFNLSTGFLNFIYCIGHLCVLIFCFLLCNHFTQIFGFLLPFWKSGFLISRCAVSINAITHRKLHLGLFLFLCSDYFMLFYCPCIWPSLIICEHCIAF